MSLVVLAFVALPSAAVASGSAQSAYSEAAPVDAVSEAAPEETGTAGTETNSQAMSATEEPSGNSVLPFTGEDLAVVLLLGVALFGIGLLIRRANRSTAA